MFPEASVREAYGKALVELGKRLQNLVVLDADLSPSTHTRLFARQFPDRFFDCGIAEQNMMSIAAGLAASGKIVFASTFAVFITKAFDQIRMGIAQPGLNVKIVATHGGISVGQDGLSHHGVEDLALMGSFPGFRIIVPSDAPETSSAVEAAAMTPGPFYIRLCRPKTPVIHTSGADFKLGRAEKLEDGEDATVIACGLMVAKALEAVRELRREGINCRLLNIATIKPLDEEAVLAAARETGAIVTAEEHLEHGGLGSQVARAVVKLCPVPMEFVALKDAYARSGQPEDLFRRYGLSIEHIKEAVRRVLRLKSAGGRARSGTGAPPGGF